MHVTQCLMSFVDKIRFHLIAGKREAVIIFIIPLTR